jgi:hypothetical protein
MRRSPEKVRSRFLSLQRNWRETEPTQAAVDTIWSSPHGRFDAVSGPQAWISRGGVCEGFRMSARARRF